MRNIERARAAKMAQQSPIIMDNSNQMRFHPSDLIAIFLISAMVAFKVLHLGSDLDNMVLIIVAYYFKDRGENIRKTDAKN